MNVKKLTLKTGYDHVEGTSLQGYLTASYSDLVSLFGRPSEGDGHKVDVEWYLLFEEGGKKVVATIYNWKNGINYCGKEEGIPTKKITEWHIGGHLPVAAEMVKAYIDRYIGQKPKPKTIRLRVTARAVHEAIIEVPIPHNVDPSLVDELDLQKAFEGDIQEYLFENGWDNDETIEMSVTLAD